MDRSADPTQLTTSDPNIACEEKVWPTVAPDGKTVFFQYSTHDGTSGQTGIYSVPIGGGDITPVIQDNLNHEGLQITPDGENFVYVDERGITVRPVGGGPATTLYARDACKRNSGFQGGCGYPSISPDGTKVAFTDTTAVYTVPFSTTGGGTATKVPGSEAGRGFAGFLSFDLRIDETVSFSPDGRFIAYNALRLPDEIGDCGGFTAYCGWAETRWIPVEGGNYEGVHWADFTAATQVDWAPAPDTTAPEVDAVTPADGTQRVERGSTVTAEFSEAVRASTLTSESVQLFSGKSTRPIKAVLSWNPSTDPTSVTLTPLQRLDAKTRYTAKIKGGSTGVKDLAGNPLASDFSWSFTTGSL
jgi:hypothetical protein